MISKLQLKCEELDQRLTSVNVELSSFLLDNCP